MGFLLDVSMVFIYSMHCSTVVSIMGLYKTVLPENQHSEIEINVNISIIVHFALYKSALL